MIHITEGETDMEIDKVFQINPSLHGGTIFPLVDYRSAIVNGCKNWLIFHDFVPVNIRKDLERPFLIFFLKISKILA